MKVSLIPGDGWSTFHKTEELQNLIWCTLKNKDGGGIWEYHNFTSNSSLWANGSASLSLQFETESCKKITNLDLTLADPNDEELKLLIIKLELQYGLVSKYC